MQRELDISASTAVWLTGTVQLGFVVRALTATTLNISDRMPAHLLVGISGSLAALCTLAVAQLKVDLLVVLGLRFLTGIFLAGVYPTGMKLMATWAPSTSRGLAMGLLIGALALGSSLPHLIGGLVVMPWRTVLIFTAIVGISGATLAFVLVRTGPALLECGHR